MAGSWHPSLYTPLDSRKWEVRLLSISKAEHQSSPLECDVRVFRLHVTPPFDALSYVWGDPSLVKEIQFGGRSRLITASLFDALIRLRDRADSAWVWVDALCINQNDAAEKNRQIPLMKAIYTYADTVFSWLGEADLDTRLAFSLVERWANAMLPTNPKLERFATASVKRDALKTIDRPYDPQEWTAFINFTQKPYWGRLWVLQEVTLTSRCVLLCGDHELKFERLMRAYQTWTSGDIQSSSLDELVKPAGNGTLFYNFMDVSLEKGSFINMKVEPHEVREFRELRKFPFLLKRASMLFATDPRDKVYGVLGLLTFSSSKIPVDYDSEIVDAYKDTLVTVAEEVGRLDMLSFAGKLAKPAQNVSNPLWPSWVPDFASPEKCDIPNRFAESFIDQKLLLFNASGDSVAHCSIDTTEPRLLHVRGMLLSEISALVQSFPTSDPQERLRSWLAFTVQHASNIKPREISSLQLLFRTMIADHLWRGLEFPDCLTPELEMLFFRLAADFLLAIRKILDDDCSLELGEEDTPWSPPRSPLPPEIRQTLTAWLYEDAQHNSHEASQGRPIQVRNFLNQPHLQWPNSVDPNDVSFEHADDNLSEFYRVFARTVPRCLFITADGHLGAGPGGTEVGDRLFVPLGCSVPLVIRRRGDRFDVVADAYIGGVMQGELFSGKWDELIDLTDVVLQ